VKEEEKYIYMHVCIHNKKRNKRKKVAAIFVDFYEERNKIKIKSVVT